MNGAEKKLSKFGIAVPELLLPRGTGMGQWAAVACDQFTQDRAYWEKAEEIVGSQPSTLRFVLPEARLGDEGRAERIARIHADMENCLRSGTFAAPMRGFVYLERDTPFNRGRRGLVAAIDLERYSWSKDARTLIRPTEGTVAARLPARMEIRRNAPLETSHVIILIDDAADELIPRLGERAKKSAPVYGGELMMNSGSVNGWFLGGEDDWAHLADGLAALSHRAAALPREQPFLFAVGDGNHSLAGACEVWRECKSAMAGKSAEPPAPPCRYALVEIENIHDGAVKFEPIHRITFDADFDSALSMLSALPGFSSRAVAGREELARLVAQPIKGNRFGLVSQSRSALIETSAEGIAAASLQPLLDKTACASSIDYIHGEDELFRLALSPEKPAVGILLPPAQKAGFFDTIARTGPLPRKSFSMGEACEKRFYLECRRLGSQ